MFLKTLLNCNTAVLHLLLEHRRQLAGYLCEFFFFVYHCNHIKVTKHMLEVIMRSETSQPVLKISQKKYYPCTDIKSYNTDTLWSLYEIA